MAHWSTHAVFYHIYPLGLAGAPLAHDPRQFTDGAPLARDPGRGRESIPVPEAGSRQSRLAALHPWVEHCARLGVTALYLGPVFESSTHGYDTVDYFTVDGRLGSNDDLRAFVGHCHAHKIRVVLDAVFNHVGRDHHAFRDVLEHGPGSVYRDWFYTDFSRRSPCNDAFWYESWNGHSSLVKLNLSNAGVRAHLFAAVRCWSEAFGIDGLRLDAADSMEKSFFNELRAFTGSLKKQLWLMGEVIHGDYTEWVSAERLHSVTNYELYKGLWSSHNDRNYFEVAHSANRQFGPSGIYKGLTLYNFADNHDVDRVASTLTHRAHLYPLHILLFTLPGIPSLYYGSEWGIAGKKTNGSDAALRPALDLGAMGHGAGQHDLCEAIRTLIRLRSTHVSLRSGAYTELAVDAEQYAFQRSTAEETTIVAVNDSAVSKTIRLATGLPPGTVVTDVLNRNERFTVVNGSLELPLFPNWGRILVAG